MIQCRILNGRCGAICVAGGAQSFVFVHRACHEKLPLGGPWVLLAQVIASLPNLPNIMLYLACALDLVPGMFLLVATHEPPSRVHRS